MIEQLKSDRLTADLTGYELREGSILVKLLEGDRKSEGSSLIIPQKTTENIWGIVVVSEDKFATVGSEVLIPKKPMQRWLFEGEICVVLFASDIKLKKRASNK